MQENIITFTFLIAAFGQVLLVLSILVTRLSTAPIYTPLAVFFLTSGFSFTLPALLNIFPDATHLAIYLLFPCVALQPVMLWLYAVGLTSPTLLRLHWGYWPHFIPFAFSCLFSLGLFLFGQSTIDNIIINGKEPINNTELFMTISLFVLLIFYVTQISSYLVCIIKRLLRYQTQLKQLFSSNEKRELIWILWLVLILAGSWLVTLVYLFSSLSNTQAPFNDQIIAAGYFILVWTLAVWGLRQKPGFHGRYLPTDPHGQLDDSLATVIESTSKKYQRSALDTPQAERIAKKLETAMQNEQLFLKAELSLPMLSKHLQVPANYLSQTLNDKLQESFFDYINRWRIEYAKDLIIKNDLTILDVAMDSGFNAKSSFYKAFKKYTGKTPSQFRTLTE